MANPVNTKKPFGFEISLKNKDKENVGNQKITFSNQDKFLIGVKEDGTSLASVELINGNPHLIVNPNQLDLGKIDQDVLTFEDGRQAYLLSELEIDSANNLKLKVTSQEATSFSNIQFLANEIVIEKNKEKRSVATPILNFDLPQNLFQITNQENSYVTVKTLPAQFMSVMSKMQGVATLNIPHKGRNLTIARVGKKSNPQIYIVNGTSINQHNLEDFYIHNPEDATQNGFIGIKTSKSGTKAYGLNDISKENIDSILNFISTLKSRENIRMLTKEQLNEQVLKPRTLRAAKDREKFATSNFVANPEEQSPEEQPQETPQQDNLNFKKSTDDQDTDGEDGEGEGAGSIQNEKEFGVAQGNQGQNETSPELDENNPNESTNEKVDTIDALKGDESEEENDDAPEGEKEKPKEEEPEIVNLQDLAKMFGIGLFLFGLFTGFGGILLSILAVGIGTSSATFSDKLKKVPLPKGKAEFKKKLKEAKEKGIVKEVDPSKPSTAKEEIQAVEHLEKEGVISEEFAGQIKNIINHFAKTQGMLTSVKDFFTKQADRAHLANRYYQEDYAKAQREHNGHEVERLKPHLEDMENGANELDKIDKEFIKYHEEFSKSIALNLEAYERYETVRSNLTELEKRNLDQEIESVSDQMDNLIIERDKLDAINNRSEAEEQNYTVVLDNIRKLDIHLAELYEDKEKFNDYKEQLSTYEQTVLKPETLKELNNAFESKMKAMFKKFYTTAEKVESISKKYAKIDKKDKALNQKIEKDTGLEF